MSELCAQLAGEVRVLCLDEFQVVDVADAMLLRSLLTQLLDRDVHFVLTSNRQPQELYLNGIQRSSFLPCIDLLERRLEVVPLIGEQDYRQQTSAESIPEIHIFEHPINAETLGWVEQVFSRLAKGLPITKRTLRTHGRNVAVARCVGDVVASFTFAELCGSATSAADYLTLARAFSTLVITEVPVLGPEQRDEARRFITLVDILYDNRNRLVLQMAAPLERLFQLEGHPSTMPDRRDNCKDGEVRNLAEALALAPAELVRARRACLHAD